MSASATCWSGASATRISNLTPILLIHGAFHTGQSWERLVPLLQARGYDPRTPTLRGQAGNKRHPLLVSWQSYAADIVACAEAGPTPAVLLGHSLAGFAISAAAERRPELFSSLIYLAAAVPTLGRCTLASVTRHAAAKAPKMRPVLRSTFPPEQAAAFFYNTAPPEVQARAVSLLSPQPVRPLLGALRTTPDRLGRVPKHYIECAFDRVNDLDGQRAMQGNQVFQSVRRLQTDHSPFYSDPQALADAIAAITPPG